MDSIWTNFWADDAKTRDELCKLEKLVRSSIEEISNSSQSEQSDRADAQHDLAVTRIKLHVSESECEQNIDIALQAWECRCSAFGTHHLKTLSSLYWLAKAQRACKDLHCAVLISCQVLIGLCIELGSLHADTIRGAHWLAALLTENRQNKEAIELLDAVVRKYTRVLGAEHASTTLAVRELTRLQGATYGSLHQTCTPQVSAKSRNKISKVAAYVPLMNIMNADLESLTQSIQHATMLFVRGADTHPCFPKVATYPRGAETDTPREDCPLESAAHSLSCGDVSTDNPTRLVTLHEVVQVYEAEAGGYLSLCIGDLVTLVSNDASEGDPGCKHEYYNFGIKQGTGDSGWMPSDVLRPSQWQCYVDEDGRPWLFNAQTEAWKWEVH
jgi:hypothetical protein